MNFFPALDAGYEPKDYAYAKADIPIGTFVATLDFMLWSKSGLTVNCFFTLTDSGKKVTLSVYRKAANQDRYMAGGTEVRYLPFGTSVELTIEANELGKPLLVDMVIRKN
ncbi:hypothetical protein SAMN04488023_14610 [Pedobacter rhizosphaerae]|uniref:Uncharacterized protein n=2 Tax=Pedobacter rhizosphaerae TaxID=390241 RepID=A0A1H9VNQ1_9SPHI|nr:hypothetical protein SAMN04488023_14610 [Pedobacter rhizosphaerae]